MKQKASSWQMEKSYRETKANSDNVKDMNSAYFGVVEMIHASPSQSQQVTFIRKKTLNTHPFQFLTNLFGP